VIKVEPPEGATRRARRPLSGDVPHPEKSGLFLYLNANKRGITSISPARAGASPRAPRGARGPPGARRAPARDGGPRLDYQRLAATHPGLVMTSIAPFGLTGPHAGYRGPDVVTWSAAASRR